MIGIEAFRSNDRGLFEMILRWDLVGPHLPQLLRSRGMLYKLVLLREPLQLAMKTKGDLACSEGETLPLQIYRAVNSFIVYKS